MNLASLRALDSLLSILDSKKRRKKKKRDNLLEIQQNKKANISREYNTFILHEMQHGKEHRQMFCGLVHYKHISQYFNLLVLSPTRRKNKMIIVGMFTLKLYSKDRLPRKAKRQRTNRR